MILFLSLTWYMLWKKSSNSSSNSSRPTSNSSWEIWISIGVC